MMPDLSSPEQKPEAGINKVDTTINKIDSVMKALPALLKRATTLLDKLVDAINLQSKEETKAVATIKDKEAIKSSAAKATANSNKNSTGSTSH